MKCTGTAILMASLLLHTLTAAALEIRNVRHDRNVLDSVKHEQVTIKFTLSDPASVTLNIYDGRDLLIRSITAEAPLTGGEHDFVWDGTDQAGHGVPPGAYHLPCMRKRPQAKRSNMI